MSLWEIKSGDTEQHAEAVRFFIRHVVVIEIALRRGEDIDHVMMSTFLMSVKGHWFLITAGHWVDAINTRINDGWQITHANLHDSGHSDALDPHTVPFDYAQSYPIDISADHPGW